MESATNVNFYLFSTSTNECCATKSHNHTFTNVPKNKMDQATPNHAAWFASRSVRASAFFVCGDRIRANGICRELLADSYDSSACLATSLALRKELLACQIIPSSAFRSSEKREFKPLQDTSALFFQCRGHYDITLSFLLLIFLK